MTPVTDGGVNSYYMVVGMRPREGTLLHSWVGGNGWILWCIQQVAEVVENGRMIGWVNRTTMAPNFTGHTTSQIEQAIKAMAGGDPATAQAMRDYEEYQERTRKRGSDGW